jgi:hypothetical protein
MRSDWIRRLVSILLVLLASCITYKPQGIIKSKGARIRIDCGYEETLTFYDVTAFFVDKAMVKPSTSFVQDQDLHAEVLTLFLVPGNHKVLALYGYYEKYPNAIDTPNENFFFIIVLDTLSLNDSIQLASDNIECHFSYARWFPFFSIQEGYAMELEGCLVINSIQDSVLSGAARFSGEAVGYYDSAEISDDDMESWVSGSVEFAAVRHEIKEDSLVVGHICGPWRKVKTND